MAVRPVFCTKSKAPFYETVNVDFKFNAGFDISQKQKNVIAIHEAFKSEAPDKKVLEISTKSLQPEGRALSAFNLCKILPKAKRRVPVECVFQSSKQFEDGGPYLDLLDRKPMLKT